MSTGNMLFFSVASSNLSFNLLLNSANAKLVPISVYAVINQFDCLFEEDAVEEVPPPLSYFEDKNMFAVLICHDMDDSDSNKELDTFGNDAIKVNKPAGNLPVPNQVDSIIQDIKLQIEIILLRQVFEKLARDMERLEVRSPCISTPITGSFRSNEPHKKAILRTTSQMSTCAKPESQSGKQARKKGIWQTIMNRLRAPCRLVSKFVKKSSLYIKISHKSL